MTEQLEIDSEEIVTAARMLESGRLVAFPTETVYGLGADAENPEAVQQIFALKGRSANRPLSILISKDADIAYWASDIPLKAEKLIDVFWPGPLTLVLRKRSTHVSETLSCGKDSVALRCPAHSLPAALLKVFKQGKGGIAAPSANRSGYISPTTAQHVRDEFGTDGRLSMILDGGSCRFGIESTILDLSRLETDDSIILRPGVITAEQIAEVIGEMPMVLENLSDRDSGNHYAPKTPVLILSIAEIHQMLVLGYAKKMTLLVHTEILFKTPVKHFPQPTVKYLPNTPAGYAKELYAVLREADESGAEIILLEAVPKMPTWQAVHDRLEGVAETGKQLKDRLFASFLATGQR